MPDETALSAAIRLTANMEAAAALAAHIRVESEQLDVDPRVRQLLGQIATEICGGDASGPAAAAIVGMVRALMRQAGELIDNPGRCGDWDQLDEGILQGLGRMSMTIVDALRVACHALPGLEQRLSAPGATFLDVGTGTGWLAIAVATAFPQVHVTGIDVFEPALGLARDNVAAAGLADRVTLERADAAELTPGERFDAVWLPLPFMPKTVVAPAAVAATQALRAGGWLLPGVFAGPPDRLGALLLDLRTVRSGGHPWSATELVELLDSTPGLTDAREVPRTWSAPVRLFAGRRA